MSESQISFYEKHNGIYPVLEFLNELPQEESLGILAKLSLLDEKTHIEQRQHIRHLQENLWEIKIRCYRILFSYQDDAMLLLHGFHKKTQKTPPKQIEIAQRYLCDYLIRKRKRR